MRINEYVIALAALSTSLARPTGEILSIISGQLSAQDVPAGKTPLSRADMEEMARLAIAVNTAYCPISRQLEPHPIPRDVLEPRRHPNDLASSIVVSSRDPEFDQSVDDPDMSWYISHTPATQTLTLAFSSLQSTDEFVHLLSSSPSHSENASHLVELPSYLFPEESLPFDPIPRIHHSYLDALESHGTSALLSLLDLLESPPLPTSTSGNRLQKWVDSIYRHKEEEVAAPIKKVEIVGHGLGASIGLLVATALNLELNGPAANSYESPLPKVDISTTLFSLPKVGDSAFANWIDSLQINSQHNQKVIKQQKQSKPTTYDFEEIVARKTHSSQFKVNRIISYADTIPHLPAKHLELQHPSLGEIWIGADPRVAYICKSAVQYEESELCSNAVSLQRSNMQDHAGPFAGVWIGRERCSTTNLDFNNLRA